jgi:hypothetical protein
VKYDNHNRSGKSSDKEADVESEKRLTWQWETTSKSRKGLSESRTSDGSLTSKVSAMAVVWNGGKNWTTSNACCSVSRDKNKV